MCSPLGAVFQCFLPLGPIDAALLLLPAFNLAGFLVLMLAACTVGLVPPVFLVCHGSLLDSTMYCSRTVDGKTEEIFFSLHDVFEASKDEGIEGCMASGRDDGGECCDSWILMVSEDGTGSGNEGLSDALMTIFGQDNKLGDEPVILAETVEYEANGITDHLIRLARSGEE